MVSSTKRLLDRWRSVLGMRDLTHAERTVLSAIAWHDGANGAYPKADRIADLSAMSRARVFAIIANIEKKGRLRRKKMRGANLYQIAYKVPGIFPDTVTEIVSA